VHSPMTRSCTCTVVAATQRQQPLSWNGALQLSAEHYRHRPLDVKETASSSTRLVKIARFLRSINRHEKRSINRLTGLAREASPEASRKLHDTLFYDRPTTDSTDVPVVPSVGKHQTTLQSHAWRLGSCSVVGVHSTRSQQRHSSTHSCRHSSITETLFWRVRQK